jgi:hypothetical protein
MDRRIFLSGALASALPLVGCGAGAPVPVACDRPLAAALTRALEAWSAKGGRCVLDALAARPLIDRGETTEGLVLVTREPKLADRLQRQSLARLQNRWHPMIGGVQAEMVVTRGAGEGAAVKLAKWLASEDAAALLTRP